MAHPSHPTRRPSRGRRWPRRLGILVALLAVLTAGAYAATATINVPPPHRLAQLLTTAPSERGELFSARTIVASSTPSTLRQNPTASLPATVPWKGASIPLKDMLETTSTEAFLVMQDGTVVDEWYRDGVGITARMSSWSVAKSIVSLLVGQSIDRGTLTEDTRLTEVLPELATGTDYDSITVGHLLDMTSGVNVPENYRQYWPFTGTARLFLSTDLPGYVAARQNLVFEPGAEASYRSVDTQLLGMILSKVEGKPLSTLLSDGLWEPLGAESSATWNLDQPGGTEKAFCCVNATARDYARIGHLVLDKGRVDDAQIVPEGWIERISTPAEHSVSDWGYSAQWWHPPGSDADLLASGIHGQYIYVNPVSGTVIVKLSDHGTEQDKLETVDAMRAIAAHLAPKD